VSRDGGWAGRGFTVLNRESSASAREFAAEEWAGAYLATAQEASADADEAAAQAAGAEPDSPDAMTAAEMDAAAGDAWADYHQAWQAAGQQPGPESEHEAEA